jgi:hypothetical protein
MPLYDKGRQKFLEGGIAWLTDTVKAMIVDADDYTVDLTNHEFLSDVPAIGRVSISPALTGKSSIAGVAGCTNPTFASVTGDVCEACIVFKDTGVASTSPLILYISSATGLPIIPNGGNVVLVVDSGPNRLFKL